MFKVRAGRICPFPILNRVNAEVFSIQTTYEQMKEIRAAVFELFKDITKSMITSAPKMGQEFTSRKEVWKFECCRKLNLGSTIKLILRTYEQTYTILYINYRQQLYVSRSTVLKSGSNL